MVSVDLLIYSVARSPPNPTDLVRAEAQPLEVDDVVVGLGHAGGADLVGEQEGDAVPADVKEWTGGELAEGRECTPSVYTYKHAATYGLQSQSPTTGMRRAIW